MKLKILTVMLLIWTFVITGCPKGNKVHKAIDAAPRIAGQVEVLLDNIIAASDAGKLPQDKAVAMVRIIKDKVNPAVKSYTEFVATLPKGAAPSVDKFATSRALFVAVSDAITEVLVIYGALSVAQSALIRLAITAVIETIELIRSGFAIGDVHFKEAASWKLA